VDLTGAGRPSSRARTFTLRGEIPLIRRAQGRRPSHLEEIRGLRRPKIVPPSEGFHAGQNRVARQRPLTGTPSHD